MTHSILFRLEYAMTLMKLLVLPALAFNCLPVSAASAPPRIAFEKYTLPNGLDVILVENRKLPVVAVNIWYHVGAANEKPGLTGFAHLFEHMMFAGSKHVPRGLADKLLEGAGATDSNGTTDFDRTNYFDTVPSNQLELALWVHADRMGYLLDVLDQTALTNQQDVVRNERRQSIENRPYGIVEEELYHQLFPKTHPYHASVMGSHADIQNAKLDDIRDFFKRYYRPNNASLVIAGDIDKARTRKLVEKYFGSFKRGPKLGKLAIATPPIESERRAVVRDRVELQRVFMGWLTSKAYQPGDAELTIAAQILGGGKSSRLYKKLVYELQIAQEVTAYQNSLAQTSIFVIDATARPGRTAQELEAAIDAELQKLKQDGPSEAELERARNTLETALVTQVEKLGGYGLANLLNQYNHYVGDPGYLARDIERHRKVSAADVKRVAAAQLGGESRAVVHGVPGTPDLGPEVPMPPPAQAKPARNTGLHPDEAWRSQVPKAGRVKPLTLPKADSFRLANGLTVIHHHNPALPLVTAELVVKAGYETNPPDLPGLSSFTAHMLEEGTASRSALQIADQAAQLGATLTTSANADGSRGEISALKGNFAAALDLLADVMLHPAFPEDEIERQRKSRLGELAQQRDNAPLVASVVGARALFGPAHPYGYGDLGTEAAIKAVRRADLLAFWQRHYVPARAALVVAGDVTRDELKALAEAKFGAWRADEAGAPPAAAARSTPARLVIVDKPGAPQTALRLVAPGPDRKAPDYPVLEVMNAAFGGLFTSRLSNNLREDKGYTYGIRSQFQYRRQPGPFVIATSVRTDVTGSALEQIFKELDGVRAKPLAAQELKNARDSELLSLPGQFDTNKRVGASLADLFVYGLGLDYYAGLAGQLRAVTAAQAHEAARSHLQPEKLIVIAIGDRAKIEPQLEKLKLGPAEYRDADGNPLK